MKKLFTALILIGLSVNQTSAQSLSFDDLMVPLRCDRVIAQDLLIKKGFEAGGYQNLKDSKVYYYNKLLTDDGFSETCATGLALIGPVDKKKYMSVTYLLRSVHYMGDFAKQMPENMELKNKKDGVYYYENTDMYMQIAMTLDPKKKPYSIYILSKKPYDF